MSVDYWTQVLTIFNTWLNGIDSCDIEFSLIRMFLCHSIHKSCDNICEISMACSYIQNTDWLLWLTLNFSIQKISNTIQHYRMSENISHALTPLDLIWFVLVVILIGLCCWLMGLGNTNEILPVKRSHHMN